MPLSRKARAELENPSKRTKVEKPATIQVGDALPRVEVTLQTGAEVNLAEAYGDKILAIFAYPKASTPGCTRQTSGFGELYPEFSKLGVAVFGLSADSPKAQTTFKEKTGVDFDLISDPQYELLGPLGAKKSPKGVLRSHWLFVNGKAVLVEHGVKPAESPEAVLAAAKEYAKKDAPAEDSKPDDTTRPESEKADAKAEPESKPEADSEAKSAYDPKSQPGAEPVTKPEAETESKPDSRSEDPEARSAQESKTEETETSKPEPRSEANAEEIGANGSETKSENA